MTSPAPAYVTPAPADVARAPGTILAARYRLVGLLGRGGMGEVYRADDLKLGQPVALKFLPPAVATDPSTLARFHSEVRVARQVSHSNVCRIYDIVEADGEHFISMEYVDGEDLSSLLRRIGRLSPDKAVEIARQLCAGVAAAHDAGVLHRDLKPANVMLDGRGRVKVTDFGLAEVAERVNPNEIAGTPAYMAPEQLAGTTPSVRTDIYALGLILYEVFTGNAAFEAHTFEDRTRAGRDSVPPQLSTAVRDIDPAVERIVLRCLEPDPSRRPSTALSVAAALPGGDPLAAALAAGETPSPEMVAAAPVSGALRPGVAWTFFLAALVGLLVAMAISQRFVLLNRIPHDVPPAALQVKAREVLARVSPGRAPVDSVSGFDVKDDYLVFESRHAPDDKWRDNLFRGEPPALTYWYREGPNYLVSDGSPRPTMRDPPLDLAGMSLVELDLSGRLRALTVVPAAEWRPAGAPVDWRYLFEAAGLRLDEMRASTPDRRPPVFADSVHAWEGNWPGRPDLALRVTAASAGGAPVHFAVLGPWSPPGDSEQGRQARPLERLFMPLIIVLIASAALLAVYNLNAGRGDRIGATRLAVYVLALGGLTFVFQSHHVPSIFEVGVLGKVASYYLLQAGIFWVAYLALEPYVRRRTPDLIISWTRLLAGKVGDPLVGRDILYGAVFAAVGTLLNCLHTFLAWRAGQRLMPLSGLPVEDAFDAARAIGTLSTVQIAAIQSGIFAMFLFVILAMLLRRRIFAVAAFFGIAYVFFVLMFEHRTMSGLLFALFPATLITVFVTRFGLLTAVSFHVFLFLSEFYPAIGSLSDWFAPATLVALACSAALAFYGLFVCLGGRPFAGLVVLGDEFAEGR